MAVTAYKLGKDCKMYFGGTQGVGGTEMTNVKDVTLTLEKGEADVSTRGNAGWEATVGTQKKASLEFKMVWNTDDTGFAALQEAFFGDDAIGICVLDGVGGHGLKADWNVTKFSRSEPLNEAVMVDVSLKPTYSDTAPSWV